MRYISATMKNAPRMLFWAMILNGNFMSPAFSQNLPLPQSEPSVRNYDNDPFPSEFCDSYMRSRTTIYFAQGEFGLGTAAIGSETSLQGALQIWRRSFQGPIMLEAYADTVEIERDSDLPERRLHAVSEWLINRGVDRSLIWSRRGELSQRNHPDDPVSRSVDIFVPQDTPYCLLRNIIARLSWLAENCTGERHEMWTPLCRRIFNETMNSMNRSGRRE